MPNRLIYETSPYLLQHAHNPVDRYPWGEEALQRAKAEDKPIFLSIGYSSTIAPLWRDAPPPASARTSPAACPSPTPTPWPPN